MPSREILSSDDVLLDLTAAAETVWRKSASTRKMADIDPRVERAFLSIPLNKWSFQKGPAHNDDGEEFEMEIFSYKQLSIQDQGSTGNWQFFVEDHNVQPTEAMNKLIDRLEDGQTGQAEKARSQAMDRLEKFTCQHPDQKGHEFCTVCGERLKKTRFGLSPDWFPPAE